MRSNDGTFQDDGQVQRYVNQVNDEVDFHCFNEQMKNICKYPYVYKNEKRLKFETI